MQPDRNMAYTQTIEITKENKLIHQLRKPLFFKLYLLRKLPMGLFAGLRIEELEPNRSCVSVPFGYRNKNPFRSMYFASLSMAAELSTGILALIAAKSEQQAVSMLVLGMRAEFVKKARTRVRFACKDGENMHAALQKSLRSGEGQEVEALATGTDKEGETVARFWFSWSFKNRHIHNQSSYTSLKNENNGT